MTYFPLLRHCSIYTFIYTEHILWLEKRQTNNKVGPNYGDLYTKTNVRYIYVFHFQSEIYIETDFNRLRLFCFIIALN